MLIMHLFVRGIDVGHVFVCYRYRCWACICVLGILMLAMYLCVRGIYNDHILMCLCIDVGHVFVC
jgi:hypothetical protein